jgi:hypothetical protein
VTAAAARTRRPRRPRGAEESLLSVVLVTEAVLLIFVALTANGLRALPTAVALGGGAGAIVVVLVASALVRWRAGVLFGWLVQFGLVLCGLVLPVMWGIGALFLAIWIYCALTGRRLDRRNAAIAAASDLSTTTPDQGEQ